jgi:hypothetical protein
VQSEEISGSSEDSIAVSRGFLCGGQGTGVDHVLGNFKPVCPVVLLVVAEDSQDCFHRLIHSFGLSVSLGVVCRTHVLFDL